MKNLRDLLRTYSGVRRSIAAVSVLNVAGAAFETVSLLLLVPIAAAVAVGNDEINRTFGELTITVDASVMVMVAISCVIAGLGVRLVTNLIQTRAVVAVERRQRGRIYDGFLHTSWSVQSAEPQGRFQWVTNLTSGYAGLLGVVLNTQKFIINLVTMLVAAFLVSPPGAAAILGVGGGMFLAMRPLIRASRNAQARALAASQRQNEGVGELVPLSGPIRSFGVTARFNDRLARDTRAVLKEKRTAMLLSAAVAPIYQASGLLIALGILAYATTRQLDVPALGAVALLLLRSLSSAQGIQNGIHKYAELRPTLEALEEWNLKYAENRETFGTVDVGSVNEIDLTQVKFRYSNQDLALDGVHIALSTGDDLGLVGPSGAGKTTLAQVLLRMRRSTSGSYRINGIDAWDISEECFAREVAYVPQSALILRGTVAENITLFRPDVDQQQVVEAASAAGVDDWIRSLPDGYDTVIGPDTRGFSGGQAQRLSIARALAGRPSLLILDEPTSALDVDSEELVTTTLEGLPEHVIVVVIAHRMSTLKHCNRIVVLEDGKVAASGSTADALQSNAFFKRAVDSGALTSSAS